MPCGPVLCKNIKNGETFLIKDEKAKVCLARCGIKMKKIDRIGNESWNLYGVKLQQYSVSQNS